MRKLLSILLACCLGVGAGYAAKRLFFNGDRVVMSTNQPGQKADTSAPGHKADMPHEAVAVEPVRFVPLPVVVPSHYSPDSTPEKPLTLVGYLMRGKRFNAVLSDGRTITERTGHNCDSPGGVKCLVAKCEPQVVRIERNGVQLRGGQFVGFRTIARADVPKPAEKTPERASETPVPVDDVPPEEKERRATIAGATLPFYGKR